MEESTESKRFCLEAIIIHEDTSMLGGAWENDVLAFYLRDLFDGPIFLGVSVENFVFFAELALKTCFLGVAYHGVLGC